MAVDYDPQKAHQYYLKKRKLKGRHSTKGMSKSQKEQWSYAKEQLKKEHKDINADITEAAKTRRQSLAESAKRKRERLTEQANESISRLREQMKNLSPAQKAMMKDRLTEMIASIRGDLKADKASLSEATSAQRQDITDKAKESRAKEAKDYESRKDEAYRKIKGKR